MEHQSHINKQYVWMRWNLSQSYFGNKRGSVLATILILKVLLFLTVVVSRDANALCVEVPEANLRSGPGTGYQKTWEVFKYMPFKKINKKGNWYKVQDVDGDRHWIYKKLVTDNFDCAVVKVNKANIRSGPGMHFKKKDFSPSLQYDSYKVLKRIGKWVEVVDEFGNKGWIFRKLLWIY